MTKFFTWAEPLGDAIGYDLGGHQIIQSVRLAVNKTGFQWKTTEEVADGLDSLISSRNLAAEDTCIILQNFGRGESGTGITTPNPSVLYREPLDAATGGVAAVASLYFANGITNAREYMSSLLQDFTALPGRSAEEFVPHLWAFDIENQRFLSNSLKDNWQNIKSDDRFTTEILQPYNKTLEQILLDEGIEDPDPTRSAFSTTNRAWAIQTNKLVNNLTNGAFVEGVVKPIRDVYGTASRVLDWDVVNGRDIGGDSDWRVWQEQADVGAQNHVFYGFEDWVIDQESEQYLIDEGRPADDTLDLGDKCVIYAKYLISDPFDEADDVPYSPYILLPGEGNADDYTYFYKLLPFLAKTAAGPKVMDDIMVFGNPSDSAGIEHNWNLFAGFIQEYYVYNSNLGDPSAPAVTPENFVYGITAGYESQPSPTPIKKQFYGENYLYPTYYNLLIDSVPGVVFFSTNANLPGFGSSDTLIQPTRFIDAKHPASKVAFDNLEFEFLVDEDMTNWMQLYNWIRRTSVVSDHDFYLSDTRDHHSDGTMFVTNSAMRPNYAIRFHNMFPVSIEGFDFDSSMTSLDPIRSKVVFSFDYYDIEKV